MGSYDYTKTLVKGIKYLVIFGVPLPFLDGWQAVAIGTCITMFINWQKHQKSKTKRR